MAHAPAALAIYLLGPPRIERHGQPVEVDTRKAIALLAYLALHPERLSRDQLAAFLWPEYDHERAYANLRRTIWALNKAIGEEWIAADNLTLAVRRQEGLWLDVLEFQRWLAQCRQHNHRPEESCPACLEPLALAVNLVRGDFLEGFSLRDSAPFDDWHFFEAESLRKTVAATLEKLVQGHSSQQEDEIAITYARRWLALDPLHEPAHCWLMQLYAWAGQPAAAIRQYQECVRILKAELDAPPTAETTALYQRIRSKQIGPRPAKPTPATAPPPPAEAIPRAPTSAPSTIKEPPLPQPPVMEEQLRLVTVLCVTLTEPLPPPQSAPGSQHVQRLKALFQQAEAILLRYEGRVERFLGEGVVALFGAQQQHEDDPERAVRAALELRQAAQSAGLQMSAGITTGHVYLTSQGTSTATLGPVVNLALRLQSKADVDQWLASEATYRQTRGIAVYTPLSLALQNNAAPLPVYQIEHLHPHPQKVRGIAGLQAPLVGRAKELATLQAALATLHQGEGQLITLIGEAGLGKSRLVSELKQIDKVTAPRGFPQGGKESGPAEHRFTLSPLHPVTLSPCLWLEGRCLEMSLSASYWPFLDILHAYLGWQPAASEADRAGRIVTALTALVTSGSLNRAQCEEMGPLLGNLLAVRFGNEWDDRLKFAGPEQIRHQTLLTLRDLLVAIAHQQPLVLVLEDLHWADSLSLDLITLLMETLAEQPLLLLCVYRPEPQYRCWQLPTLAAAKCPDHYTEVRLRELTTRQSQQLVEALLTIENLPPKVKTTILQKAQGNPLFVEEVIRSLIDAGIVYRQGEVWRAKDEIENVVVPETVQSVILSRVDRLHEPLQGLLQRAAVIGRVFTRRLLAQVVPTGVDLDNMLLGLTNHTLIYQERVIPEEEYSFKHVLVQEAIYQNTLPEKREQFHRQVGEALEQLYADTLAERYEQLAYHYDRSGVVEKAIEYLLKAGGKAHGAYLNDEAIGYFQGARRHLDSGPEAFREAHKDWCLEALGGLGQTYHGSGQMAEAAQCFRQAIALGREMQLTPRALVRLFHWLGDILWWQNQFDEKIQLGVEGLALLADDQQSVEAALMNANIAVGFSSKGDMVTAWVYMSRNATFLNHLNYTEELKAPYITLAIFYAWFAKNVVEGMKWLELLKQQALQNHDLRALAGTYGHIAIVLSETGDLQQASAYFEQSLDLFTKIGDVANIADILVPLIFEVLLPLGKLQQAESHAQRAFAILQQIGHADYLGGLHRAVGIIALCQGLPQKASNAFLQLKELDQAHGNRTEMPFVGLGRVALLQSNREAACQWLQQAISMINPTKLGNEWRYRLAVFALSALEEGYDNTVAFHTFCQHLQEEHPDWPDVASRLSAGKQMVKRLVQWFLEPTQPNARFMLDEGGWQTTEIHQLSAKIQSGEWIWYDPFADCSFRLVDGLVIQAANGRNLFYCNVSAPRLVRSTSGDFAIQAICLPLSTEQPTQGGILLWHDKQNYLRLERGAFGQHEITFAGCIDNNDVIIGRGRLPAEGVFLRLERIGARVNALCSADGAQWFTVGHVDFPVDDPVQVGMHAIGMIDRLIYPGAYPDGTAIRFESFAIYREHA